MGVVQYVHCTSWSTYVSLFMIIIALTCKFFSLDIIRLFYIDQLSDVSILDELYDLTTCCHCIGSTGTFSSNQNTETYKEGNF